MVYKYEEYAFVLSDMAMCCQITTYHPRFSCFLYKIRIITKTPIKWTLDFSTKTKGVLAIT